MIHFESDYLEGCHPRLLKALCDTNELQTVGYGTDEFCDEARAIVQELCGDTRVSVHFLVGGTQVNKTLIAAVLRPHQGVLCASSGHINVHETGAIEHSGHKVLPLHAEDGKISARSIEEAMEQHWSDASHEHIVQPGMVYVSFPTELGTIYTLQELTDIKGACAKWGLPLFIDGARLGYGLTAGTCDVTLRDIASLADVFYIGGTKQGALFGEAVVIENDLLKRDFRYFIKQNGGMLAKGRLLGIQFEALFDADLYFRLSLHANSMAEKLTAALRAQGYDFLVESPTNQVFPILPKSDAEKLAPRFGFEEWQRVDETHIGVRFCTSWATTEAQVDELIQALKEL